MHLDAVVASKFGKKKYGSFVHEKNIVLTSSPVFDY